LKPKSLGKKINNKPKNVETLVNAKSAQDLRTGVVS